MKIFSNKKFWIFGIITILWMLLICFLSAQNGEQTTKLSLAISEFLSGFMGEAEEDAVTQTHMEIRKLAHIVLFLGLGALSYLLMMYGVFPENLRYRRVFSILVAVIITAGYGYFDEWHKQFIEGRHFQMAEVLLNVVSGVAGILIVWGIEYIYNKCYSKRNERKRSYECTL